MLPPSLVYSGWCRFLLSVPARLYSPCEALCLTVQLIPVALKLRKVLRPHSILLFNWPTPGLWTGSFCHSRGRTSLVKPCSTSLQTAKLESEESTTQKEHLKPPLDFQHQLRQPTLRYDLEQLRPCLSGWWLFSTYIAQMVPMRLQIKTFVPMKDVGGGPRMNVSIR